ncbi:hypothetical protein CXY01_26520 [Cellulomonas xylanilytica]|uniref:Uncharacterized protein n=1 Tax=Cellulomonas xylanilytica TaxID=233583 RepID=A0A510V5J8_9CELL|nr:hypothetical protein CXY01_26520 [Cellulomonas xylanilytica]
MHAREPDGAGTVSYVTWRPDGRQSDWVTQEVNTAGRAGVPDSPKGPPANR